MYAVIRAGGKQFRVAPGDVIKVDQKPAENGKIEFSDVLAVSGEPGALVKPQSGARVVGSVVEEGRGDKILVFHFKRKKQYKKLQGHRQAFTAVRINEIAFDGQKFTAPDQPAAKPKKEKKEMASKQTEQKAAKKSRTGAEGKASKSSKGRTDKGTTRASQKPTKKK
jgi:large subunit ribosomal protein L21